MIFADASFLVALFVERDDHWREAWRWRRVEKGPAVTVTRLCLFEARNSIRALVIAKLCKPAEVRHALQGLERGQQEGFISLRRVPEHHLIPHAERLSQFHTAKSTHGAMDILHVSAALIMQAAAFVSFDHRQRELAETEGLQVGP